MAPHQRAQTTRLARQLVEGGYLRNYGKASFQRSTHLVDVVARLLDGLGIPYRERVQVRGFQGLEADFEVNGRYVFVGHRPSRREVAKLRDVGAEFMVVEGSSQRSDRLDTGVRVLQLGDEPTGQTIFIDDPSFSFDYAHILPKTQKCSVMHGHTSSVLVEIIGEPIDGMVVDFGVAKEVVREAVRALDHKLFINKKYLVSSGSGRTKLEFTTVHGRFLIEAPTSTTVLLEGEATVENLAREVLQRVAPKMPANVSAVGVYVYEGMNKGSHILARIHQREDKRQRRRR